MDTVGVYICMTHEKVLMNLKLVAVDCGQHLVRLPNLYQCFSIYTASVHQQTIMLRFCAFQTATGREILMALIL